MTLEVVDDENYSKLGHLYGLCKNYKIFGEDEYETILLNNVVQNVFNYQLPAHSSFCQKEKQNIGNTILHLIVKDSSRITSKNILYLNTLIKLNADFTIKNSNGYTPLLLAFNNNEIIDSLLKAHIQKNNATNIRCKNGISHFHVACSSDQVEVVDFFLKSGVDVNERVNCNSPKFPGYTPLHFAVTYNQHQVIELLSKNRASWNTEDANGISALHLLIKRLFAREYYGSVPMILKREIQSDVLKLPDNIGLTRLHLDGALGNRICIQTELPIDTIDSVIQLDSPLWPKQTPLHFAAHFAARSYNSEIVFSLVEGGADLLAKDATGTTPLDLIVKIFERKNIIRILSRDKRYGMPDLKLTNNLNLLGVLNAIVNASNQFETSTNKQLKDVNTFIPLKSPLWPGYNLLHLAVILDEDPYKIIKKLLSQNVDFLKSKRGSTSPLHLAFRLGKNRVVDMILSYHKKIPADSVDQDNLSHLHIACVARNNELVELLLKNGADSNLQIEQDIKCTYYDSDLIKKGSTALHIAVKNVDLNLIEMLLSFKANTKATDADGITAFEVFINKIISFHRLYDDYEKIVELILKSYPNQITNVMASKLINITVKHHPNLYKSTVLVLNRERRFKNWGLTRLHIACALDNLSMTKEELMSGAEVNHRISFDSPFWPGDTAMHILFRNNETDSRHEIAKLLLDYGADPTIKNADNQTVIHLYYSQDKYKCLQDIPFLLRDKYTKINPVDNEGLSHLHICSQTKNLLIIEELLKSGANINAQVDYFADNFAGYTPLHFAVEEGKKTTVELLINYGADPNIRKANGSTALHWAVMSSYAEVVKILLRCPTIDVQVKNGIGQTVLEHIINCRGINMQILNLLLENPHEISANSRVFLKATFELKNEIYKKLINNLPDLTAIDRKGQNFLHYIASLGKRYCRGFRVLNCLNIKEIVDNGCEINHKDQQGRTPLHIATSKMEFNEQVFKSLLDLGADINIKDDRGNTPCVDIPNTRASFFLVHHIEKLELAEIFVDNSNTKYYDYHDKVFVVNSDAITAEKKKLDAKLKETHSSFTVKYFFSERFVIDYRRLPAFQRQAVCNFCNLSDLFIEFHELYPLIRRQFGKARSRTRLLEPAENALRMLANVMFPELCSDLILSFLSNDDLMNLIRAENGELIFAPLPENC